MYIKKRKGRVSEGSRNWRKRKGRMDEDGKQEAAERIR